MTVSFNVLFKNHPPITYGASLSTMENTDITITLNATDPDFGQTLTYSLLIPPSNGTIYQTDTSGRKTGILIVGQVVTDSLNRIVYSPNIFFSTTGSKPDSFVWSATDGIVSTTETTYISVEFVNQPPFFEHKSVLLQYSGNGSLTFSLPILDVDEKSFFIVSSITSPSRGIWEDLDTHEFIVKWDYINVFKVYSQLRLSLQHDDRGGG